MEYVFIGECVMVLKVSAIGTGAVFGPGGKVTQNIPAGFLFQTNLAA